MKCCVMIKVTVLYCTTVLQHKTACICLFKANIRKRLNKKKAKPVPSKDTLVAMRTRLQDRKRKLSAEHIDDDVIIVNLFV